MDYWDGFGASVIGPGHIAACKPNQDSWLVFRHSGCIGAAVSDGLGSKKFSNFGSTAACRAVEKAVLAIKSEKAPILDDSFISLISENWLDFLGPINPQEASATCLWAVIYEGWTWLGMLGDGCIAAIKKSGDVVLLEDDKSDGFSNITTALSQKTAPNDWRMAHLPNDDCAAIVLCTDGVSDDIEGKENLTKFVTGYVKSCQNASAVQASKDTAEMLEKWPTPKHTDDKTIACLLRRTIDDER